MPTLHVWRIILIIPAAKVAAVVTWFNNNIGPNAVSADLGPGLNASGLAGDPVTHRWCNGSWQDGDARLILRQLCILAGVTPPTLAVWNGWTRQEKIDWLQSVQAGIWSGYGAWVTLADNEGNWHNAPVEANGRGLQVQAAGPGA